MKIKYYKKDNILVLKFSDNAVDDTFEVDSAVLEVDKDKNPVSPSEFNLDAEWERQVRKYVELGFHTELGLPEDDYVSSLPKFESQPDHFKGRLDYRNPLDQLTRVFIKA